MRSRAERHPRIAFCAQKVPRERPAVGKRALLHAGFAHRHALLQILAAFLLFAPLAARQRHRESARQAQSTASVCQREVLSGLEIVASLYHAGTGLGITLCVFCARVGLVFA